MKLSRFEKTAEYLADSMISHKKIQDYVEEQGGKVRSNANAYSQASLAVSRSKDESERYKNEYMAPLGEAINNAMNILIKKGLTTEEDARNTVSSYLYAKHAPERNKKIIVSEARQKLFYKIPKDSSKGLRDCIEEYLNSKYDNIFSDKPLTSNMNVLNLNAEETKIYFQAVRYIDKKLKGIKDSDKGNNRSGMTDEEALSITSRLESLDTLTALAPLNSAVKKCSRFIIDTWENFWILRLVHSQNRHFRAIFENEHKHRLCMSN